MVRVTPIRDAAMRHLGTIFMAFLPRSAARFALGRQLVQSLGRDLDRALSRAALGHAGGRRRGRDMGNGE